MKDYISSNPSNSDVPILHQIQEKIYNVQKENSELVCLAIKFNCKLLEKLIEILEGKNKDVNMQSVDVLKTLRVLLKVTRLCVEKASEEIIENNNNERKLFEMIKTFSEKCQSKLYQISQKLISNISQNTSTKTFTPKVIIKMDENVPTSYSDSDMKGLPLPPKNEVQSTDNDSCDYDLEGNDMEV